MTTKTDRQRRDALGRRAELISAWMLRIKGYRVLARRFKTPVGEIDLIAKRGPILAFIEVKARPSITDAMGSVTSRQRLRIQRAAETYLQKRRDLADVRLRFDIILVVPWQWPRHIVDAWRES